MKSGTQSCEDALLLLSASLDEEVTVEERMQLEAHLSACANCRREEAEMLKVHELLQPGSTTNEVVLLTSASVDSYRQSPIRQVQWLSVAAASALILLSAAAVLLRSTPVAANAMLEPLSQAQQITAHKRAAQDTVLQTMEWELRTLKLHLAESEADAATQQEISARLQMLLDRVSQAQPK